MALAVPLAELRVKRLFVVLLLAQSSAPLLPVLEENAATYDAAASATQKAKVSSSTQCAKEVEM